MIWGRAVRAGARSAARGAASHVATGAARSRADAWVWGASAFSPGACGASGLGRGSARGGSEAAGRARQPARGAESSAAERSRAERGWGRPGLRSEVQPRATCKCLGAQPPPWSPPALCLQQQGAGWGRLEGEAAGPGGQRRRRFSIYKFPELPALAPPPAAREAGRLGRPGLRVPARLLQPPLACGGGVTAWPCVPRCARCPPGTDCAAGLRGGPGAPPPGVRRAPGLAVLVSPVLRLGSRRRRREELRVSAELRRFPQPGLSEVEMSGEGGEGTSRTRPSQGDGTGFEGGGGYSRGLGGGKVGEKRGGTRCGAEALRGAGLTWGQLSWCGGDGCGSP